MKKKKLKLRIKELEKRLNGRVEAVIKQKLFIDRLANQNMVLNANIECYKLEAKEVSMNYQKLKSEYENYIQQRSQQDLETSRHIKILEVSISALSNSDQK